MKNKNYFLLIFRILSIIIIIVALYYILNWYLENKKSEQLLNNIFSSINDEGASKIINELENNSSVNNENLNSINFEPLFKINNNTIAWLTVKNTNINYPIVKYTNNSFYLNHSFDNSYNTSGWPFMDYTNDLNNNDKNLVIYGHNRRDGSMFASLKNVLNENWYSNTDNYIIYIYTPTEVLKYKVFSVYNIKAETYYCTTHFKFDSEYSNFLKLIQKRSIYNFNEPLDITDNILTLSTCADNNSYRIVLHAKRIDV